MPCKKHKKYEDGGVVNKDKKKKKKGNEPSMWDRFKEGFKPAKDRLDDERRRKLEKDWDRHSSNRYEDGGIAKKKARREALKRIARKASK